MSEARIAVGKSLERIDGIDKVTGSARYAPDIKLENMLCARLLRSPHAHARVTDIDTAAPKDYPASEPWQPSRMFPGSLNTGFPCELKKKRNRCFYATM